MTVRDAVFDVLRRRGLTTIFGNPGSTEIAFLTGLPDDLRFVLALHEGSVAGMATGWAIGRGEPAFVLLHTTAGLGNAVGALATARVNKAPLVVLVGQQDRRHLAFEPFLAGRLEGLAGEYAVSVELPVLAEEVPGAVDRAWHRAALGRGPAIVIVPMDDWAHPTHAREDASAGSIVAGQAVDEDALAELAELVDGARSPALVVGADADDADSWAALVAPCRAACLPRLAGVVRGARRVPAGPRALRRPPARRPAADYAVRWPATTSSSWWVRLSFVSTAAIGRAVSSKTGRGSPS